MPKNLKAIIAKLKRKEIFFIVLVLIGYAIWSYSIEKEKIKIVLGSGRDSFYEKDLVIINWSNLGTDKYYKFFLVKEDGQEEAKMNCQQANKYILANKQVGEFSYRVRAYSDINCANELSVSNKLNIKILEDLKKCVTNGLCDSDCPNNCTDKEDPDCDAQGAKTACCGDWNVDAGEECDRSKQVAHSVAESSEDKQYKCNSICRASGGYCGDGVCQTKQETKSNCADDCDRVVVVFDDGDDDDDPEPDPEPEDDECTGIDWVALNGEYPSIYNNDTTYMTLLGSDEYKDAFDANKMVPIKSCNPNIQHVRASVFHAMPGREVKFKYFFPKGAKRLAILIDFHGWVDQRCFSLNRLGEEGAIVKYWIGPNEPIEQGTSWDHLWNGKYHQKSEITGSKNIGIRKQDNKPLEESAWVYSKVEVPEGCVTTITTRHSYVFGDEDECTDNLKTYQDWYNGITDDDLWNDNGDPPYDCQ